MINSKSFTVGLLLSALVFSCQPKDENLRPVSPSDTVLMNGTETNQMLALTFDRMAEAIHLLKASVNSDYAAQYNIEILTAQNAKATVTQDISNRIDISDLVINSKNKGVNTNAAELTSKKANINLSIKRLLTNEDGVMEKFLITKDSADEIKNAGYKYEGKKANDFSSITLSESVSIQKSADGIYNVQVSRIEETSSRKDRTSFVITKINFEMTWSGKLNELGESLKLKLLNLTVERKGYKFGTIKAKALNSESDILTLNLGQCAALDGSIKLSFAQPSVKGKPVADIVRTIDIKDSQIILDQDDFSSSAADCGGRPVVDLSLIRFTDHFQSRIKWQVIRNAF